MKSMLYPVRVTHGKMINWTYLLKGQEGGILVDPSWEKEKILTEVNRRKAAIKAVLLTHSHIDHTNLADWAAGEFHCPVYMSRVEVEIYRFRCVNLTPFEDRETIEAGGMRIIPYLTPGHTAGGTCYKEGNHLFTGDTLFIEGCGLCWGHGADPRAMFQSLQMLKKEIPPHLHIYPGHTYHYGIGKKMEDVMEKNVYLNFEEIENFISYRMRPNQTSLFKFK